MITPDTLDDELTAEDEEEIASARYMDVRNACHEFLMERDPHYRRTHEAIRTMITDRKARKAERISKQTRP